MNYTEFTGKTVDEAIAKGLKELGITVEEADIRILEEGKTVVLSMPQSLGVAVAKG